jgi:dTDP-4-dehydrorhamnose reductase
MKTMLRLAQERSTLSIVDDQIGSPTHAIDLAEMLLTIIQSKNTTYGIYHFSNSGSTSWYGFAKKIFEVNKVSIPLHPIATSQYPTPAKRPHYSVLEVSKIESTFKVSIKKWDVVLEQHSKEA